MATLNQWISQIESFHPDEIELGLERVTLVANKLGLLQQSAKVIIVAGTNGKGSCVALLESLALNVNLKVGCYTSPHLLKFNERIRLNGNDVEDKQLLDAFVIVDQARGSVALTFFEFTTLVALWLFKQSMLDLIVLEVGLGGRLDAVNIIQPDVSIITTIGYDHQSWLGDSLQQIAFEKSGICRKNIDNFIGDLQSYNLISKVRADLIDDLKIVSSKDIKLVEKIRFAKEIRIAKDMGVTNTTDLANLVSSRKINPYRLLEQNILLAVTAFQSIFGSQSTAIDLRVVIEQIQIRGRFQELSTEPLVIVDVAHNAQAGSNLRQQIEQIDKPEHSRRYAICGMMADKAIVDFIQVMNEVIDIWYFVDLPIDRAAKAKQLGAIYSDLFDQNKANIRESVELAYRKIRDEMTNIDQLFIFGSFITVAELIKLSD